MKMESQRKREGGDRVPTWSKEPVAVSEAKIRRSFLNFSVRNPYDHRSRSPEKQFTGSLQLN